MTGRVEKFRTWFYRLRPLLLGIALAASVAGAAMAPSIPFSTDPTEYLPPDDENVQFWLSMTRRFGGLDMLLVGLEEPGEPFQSDSLQAVKKITNRLAARKAEGVLLARSLTNVMGITEGEFGELVPAALADPLPQNEAELAALARRISEDGQVRGALVSQDLMGYVVLVRIDNRKDPREVASLVRDIVEEEKGQLDATYFGAPFVAGMVTSRIYAQLPYVVPLFVLLLLFPVFYLTRRFGVSLLVLTSAGISLVWWLGLMSLFGIELSAGASNAALLLMAVGAVAYGREADRWARDGEDSPESAGPWPLSMPVSILLAGGAVGCWSLTRIPVSFVAEFGRVAAVGMVAILGVGHLLFAPLLSWSKRPPAQQPPRLGLKTNTALIAVAIMMLAGSIGAAHARFLISPRQLFSQTDEVGRSIGFFDRRFGGGDILQIHVEGDFSEPAHCARLLRLSDMLEGSEHFSDVRSLGQILAFLNQQFDGTHRIPAKKDELGNLWFFLAGNEDIGPLVLENRKEAMIAARIVPESVGKGAQWVAAANRAVEASRGAGGESARKRLVALRDRHEASVPDERISAVVARALEVQGQGLPAELDPAVAAKLKEYMMSPESPFEPTQKEWEQMLEALSHVGDKAEAPLAVAVAGARGFKDMDYPPEVAGEVAATLVDHRTAMVSELVVADLMNELLPASRAGSPDAFSARARGVLFELLGPHDAVALEPTVTVSGFPAVVEIVEEPLRWGLWKAAGLLWLVMLLAALVAYRKTQPVLRCALESLLATLATFGLGYFFGIQLDFACAVLYLIPPLAGFFASGWAGSAVEVPGNARLGRAVAVGLALASLSLLITGVMPIARVGAVTALGLFAVAAFSRISESVELN